MHRSITIWPVVLAVLVAAAAPASAAPALRSSVIADDVATLRGWSVSGQPGRRAVRIPATERYAIDGRALALAPGGTIAFPIPFGSSLSLDFRLPAGGALELRLTGRPLVLRRLASGALRVSSGSRSATLPAGSAWARGGWRHIQIAGLDPLQIHVDGTRVPHGVKPGPRLRLRALRGTTQVTGLIVTRPHDSRALLLHRLAEYHARTPDRRYPLGVSADGRLRLREGEHDGFYAGALWRAYDLTGARLFRAWADEATWEHADWSRLTYAPFHGTRFLESSAAAYDRTCPRGLYTAHRCRVLRKSTGSAGGRLTAMASGNPGNWAVPTVIWPNPCAACASADEVEIRIETLMDTGLLEFLHRRSETDPGRTPGADPHSGRKHAIAHAEVAAGLLLRADGSTAEAVRTNRLDGGFVAPERRFAPGPESVWARGHASAIYGLARTGRTYARADLVSAAERAAAYLESRLPESRLMPYDLADPASPLDNAAGLLAAAGLYRLADACERLPGTCADPGRWAALGRGLLDAALLQVSPHAPMGALGEMALEPGGTRSWDDRGEWLLGLSYALEAVDAAG